MCPSLLHLVQFSFTIGCWDECHLLCWKKWNYTYVYFFFFFCFTVSLRQIAIKRRFISQYRVERFWDIQDVALAAWWVKCVLRRIQPHSTNTTPNSQTHPVPWTRLPLWERPSARWCCGRCVWWGCWAMGWLCGCCYCIACGAWLTCACSSVCIFGCFQFMYCIYCV